MRQIFMKVIHENLVRQAKDVKCPAILIYGENDDETPPEMGKHLQTLIEGADLHILPEQDHYTVLSAGRHQIAPLLKNFIERVKER